MIAASRDSLFALVAILSGFLSVPTFGESVEAIDRLLKLLDSSDYDCKGTHTFEIVSFLKPICTISVHCESKISEVEEPDFTIACIANDDEKTCPSIKRCLERSKETRTKVGNAVLADASADDRGLDVYGRKCKYQGDVASFVLVKKEVGYASFCASPTECEGGGPDAPTTRVAACESVGKAKVEDAKTGEVKTVAVCPRVNSCIKNPLKVTPADTKDAR